MGTRNLTVVVLDGEVKVAQYCQWDGYPTGQGATILRFLESIKDDDRPFKENLRKCKFVDSDYIQSLWESLGADKSGFVSMEISDRMKEEHPQFQRDLGAEVLAAIEIGDITELKNDLDFAADSLFCEYAYVLDMDNRVLEVYRGFNQSPLPEGERFKFLDEKRTWHDKDKPSKEYYSVKLARKYFFTDLPLTAGQMAMDIETPEERADREADEEE